MEAKSKGNRWSDNNLFYQNVKVIDPDNEVVFYTGKSIANLLAKYNKGKVVSNQPFVFQLNKRPSDEILELTHPIYKSPRQTRCVVCGKHDNLDRHHVIPRCVRKYFPVKYKKFAEAHDLVLTCRECHETYEQHFANPLKNKLKSDCGHNKLVISGTLRRQCYQLVYLESVMNSYEWCALWVKIERQMGSPLNLNLVYQYAEEEFNAREEIKNNIPTYVVEGYKHKKKNINNYVIKRRYKEQNTWNLIIDKYTPEGMIKLWRNHFVESMKPQYMPEYWNPNFTTYVGGFVRSIIEDKVVIL
jgi:hypothetical protein